MVNLNNCLYQLSLHVKDLLNLLIWSTFHLLLKIFYQQKTLAVNEKELCKYFEPGNHVKVVSGAHEGATGMVVKVEQHVLIILSDTTKEHVSDAFLA